MTSRAVDNFKDVSNSLKTQLTIYDGPEYTTPKKSSLSLPSYSLHTFDPFSEVTTVSENPAVQFVFNNDATQESDVIQSFEKRLAQRSSSIQPRKKHKTIQIKDKQDNEEHYHELLTSNLEEIINEANGIVTWNTLCTLHSSFVQGKEERKMFRIGNKLGEGSFGVVWSLVSSASKCIKLVRSKKKNRYTDIHAEMIANERHLLVSNNEFIATLYEYGTIHSLEMTKDASKIYAAYAVMEKCMGGDLFEPMYNGEYDNIDLLNKTAQNLISALCALEQAEIVHCDLKPNNITIADPYDLSSVRLIDFGGSVAANTESKILTPIYASPEQLYFKNRIVTPKSDVYTMGLILAQLLCCSIDSNPNEADYIAWLQAGDLVDALNGRIHWARTLRDSNVSILLTNMLYRDLPRRKLASQLTYIELISKANYEKLVLVS